MGRPIRQFHFDFSDLRAHLRDGELELIYLCPLCSAFVWNMERHLHAHVHGSEMLQQRAQELLDKAAR